MGLGSTKHYNNNIIVICIDRYMTNIFMKTYYYSLIIILHKKNQNQNTPDIKLKT